MSSGDHLLLVNLNMPAKVVFTDWKTTVRHYVNRTPFNQDNFTQAFKILIDIHIGTTGLTVGLSPNKTKRRIEVAAMGKEISYKYVAGELLSISWINF